MYRPTSRSTKTVTGTWILLTDTATGQTFQIHGKVNLVFGDGVTMVVNPTDPSSFDHFADIVGSIDNAHAAAALNHHLVG